MTSSHVLLLSALLGGAAAASIAVAEQRPVRPVTASRPTGEKIYQKWCSDCHSSSTGPGSIALQRKYQGNPPAILLQRTDLSAELVKAAVRTGVSFMPSFRKTEITDAELTALADYLAAAKRQAQPGTKRR